MLDELIKAFSIIIKYEPAAYLAAEHDVIYVGGGVEPEEYSQEDRTSMDALGFHWDQEMPCWVKYV